MRNGLKTRLFEGKRGAARPTGSRAPTAARFGPRFGGGPGRRDPLESPGNQASGSLQAPFSTHGSCRRAVYNVCAKMTIFRNLGHIALGVEIVPVKELADEMSTGVSYFEQFLWDLMKRGVADIDIPVLILGINA